MDTLTVQVMLVVYCSLAIAAAVLLWNNSAAPDALKNTGIAMASILPLLVSILPYLNAEKLETKFTYILLYDSERNEPIEGQRPNAYFSSYIHMFTNLSAATSFKVDKWTDLMGSPGLDIIEKGILEVMLLRFQSHWDIIEESSSGPTFESSTLTPGGSRNTARLSLDELRQIFQHNRLISTPGVIASPHLSLPPRSKLTANQSQESRTIVIRNPYATLTILIESGSGGVAQRGIWGVQEPDPQNMKRYFVIEFRVSAVMTLNRFKNHSPQMASYRRWYTNVSGVLSQFDWTQVDQKVERFMTRAALSKSSEQRQKEVK